MHDTTTPPTKRCTKCGEIKPLEMFSKRKTAKDRLCPYCKECARNMYHQTKDKQRESQRKSAAKNAQRTNIVYPIEKICAQCKRVCPLSDYTKARGRKDGLEPYCRNCKQLYRDQHIDRTSQYGKGYRTRNADKLRVQRRQRHIANPDARRNATKKYMMVNGDKIRAKRRESYASNPFASRSYQVSYRQKNHDKLKDKSHKYYAENCETIKSKRRIDRRTNPQIYAERHRAWRMNHPDICRAIRHRRKARIKGIGGGFTDKDIAHMRAIQQGHCCYCGMIVTLTIEHIIPTTRPNSSNDPWNLALACAKCNSSKGNKLIEEWTDRWYNFKK